MSGLSVLYAKKATEEGEWASIPNRDRTGRLREVYWALHAKSKIGPKSLGPKPFSSMRLEWRADRSVIGRARDDPGDMFILLAEMGPKSAQTFEWLEVTEVFTTVPASQIESAMRTWHRIPQRDAVDFNEFRKGIPRGRPSRVEQRKAADKVVAQVMRKLAKASYLELLEKYGYGTLVVGLPLWFAVPPDDPFRANNAIDDFITRTVLGLEDIRQRVLKRSDCPFRNVIVIWDTTPQALREWGETRSARYDDARGSSMVSGMGTLGLVQMADALEKTVIETRTPESEAPSISLHLDVKITKEMSGRGPYPELVETLRNMRHEGVDYRARASKMLRWRGWETPLKMLCFVRIRGAEGSQHRIARKFPMSHAWRAKVTRARARRLYRESKRKGRVFGRTGNANEADSQRTRRRRAATGGSS